MIRKYRIGTPFETEAVVLSIKEETGKIPYLDRNETTGMLACPLKKEDIVYGLGQNIRGINKRGFVYESNCSDDPLHTEGKRSLYGAHNFFVVDSDKKFGVFLDYPGKAVFDIGFTKTDLLTISTEDENYDLYLIDGTSVTEIVKQFRELIGRSYIAPMWAFGYGQSRWSYNDEKEVREVVENFRTNKIGLDAVYLDIDYMERYKDFTVNRETFPNLAGLAKDLKEKGVRLVPIIDAGVKIEEGYDVYEEGVAKDYFCKDENGNNFAVGVWPGKVYLPDFLNKEARDWFGEKYSFLLEQGIEGFWNDMNEPALFYSEKNLDHVFARLDELRKKNLDIHSYFEMMDLVKGISNNEEDYRSFYHNVNGKKIRHDKIHNLYGYHMTRAAGEAFERLAPDKRILMFSRSSYIGMHRYGGIWTGDNQSWWSHLLLNLKMLPSLNMCGFLFIGADLGGFGDNTSQDLLLRWLSLGVFTPLMRNHSALGTRRQEPYCFDDTDAFRRLIGIRYALLPYIYSEYMKAVLRNEMMFLPLAFVYTEDKRVKEIEDQLLVGDSIMIAPVYTQNATGRYVYLPEEMKLIRMHSAEEWEEEILPAGDHYISVELDEIVFFIRKGKLLPLAKEADCVDHMESQLTYLDFADKKAEYELYRDDGFSKDYDKEANWQKIVVEK